jgi:hypothetical protein
MSKPKYEREFEQLEALALARRHGPGPSRNDPRFALAFDYLDRLGRARRAAEDRRYEEKCREEQKRREEQRKKDEMRLVLRAFWGGK